ncbi:MAG TPA: isomerizing glutamine--fructose-6-phosphate transaminase [Verrucomicrobiae bacterium]|nr:isomerizing glutamine--fructose-6-phosphate transaminase [Verrucomicrobiae bacterium]
MSPSSKFRSHMLREIFEQPNAVLQTVLAMYSGEAGSNGFDGMSQVAAALQGLKRIVIAASGTSRHAGIAGKQMLESMATIPVEVDYASEFQHSPALTGPETLVMVITQSGETADTLGSLRKAKANGATVIAVANVSDSSIMREADARIETRAGAELAIPSTKAFTAQLAALFLFSLWIAEQTGTISRDQARSQVAELLKIPRQIESVLASEQRISEISGKYARVDDFIFAGRGIHYPIAMDGALKLKEVAYVHAEGYPLGEVKHGPLALLDESVVTVILAACDNNDPDSVVRYEKSLSGAKEIKERGGRIIMVANDGDTNVTKIADDVLYVPNAPELLLPILEIVPLQLLAHAIATLRGNDVDHPRSLVKSVRTD